MLSKEETERLQVAMDGSPRRVIKALRATAAMGKFGSPAYADRPVGEPGDDPVVIDIAFQVGPIKEVGVNGCSIEDVIDVLVTRLEGFQKGPFKCRENALAITKLEEAKLWLLYRTQKRQTQGVEGRNLPHAG